MQAGLLALVAICLCLAGCRKPATPENSTRAELVAPPTAETIARIHWLGKVNAANDTSLSGFMSIWNLPESSNLEAQVVAKLAAASWRSVSTSSAVSNTPPTWITSLLKGIVDHEVYCEVRQTTNGPAAMVLALRLPDQDLALWNSNLLHGVAQLSPEAQVIQTNQTWVVQRTGSSQVVELRLANNWMLISHGRSWNQFGSELAERARTSGTPSLVPLTNNLLRVDVDLRRVANAYGLNWKLPSEWPRIELSMAGTGQAVRTTGTLVFPNPLPLFNEPWNIPTNLVHDPLVSFTAARGFGPLLSETAWWSKLESGSAPNQLFVWAQMGLPFLSYLAVPATNSADILGKLAKHLETKVNPWMTNHGIGYFTQSSNALKWAEIPLAEPFLQIVSNGSGDFLLAGLAPVSSTNRPVPIELLAQVNANTNTVLYDWEVTGPRLQQWLNFGQLVRFALSRGQLPVSSRSFAWLKALEGNLGNSATRVTITDPSRLSIVRNSGIGLTAQELMLLADWLEAPGFPSGLQTIDGRPEDLHPAGKARKSK
jgi:hypothetical protein